MPSPLTARRLLAALALLVPAHFALADGTIGQVYVYNGGADNQGTAGDIFTAGAQGWIFQRMGLLGPQGQYPTIVGNNVESPAGTVRGTVIRNNNGDIIGFQSADGKQRAYNVDTSATTRDAWNAVADNGTLTIAKHGATGGGGITLDGGRMHDGFTPLGGGGMGTGAGNPAGPYGLPPRPGAGITLYVNGCFSSADPPGAPGSVTGSGAGVPGVGAMQGNPGMIYKGPQVGLTGTDQQIEAAAAALERCAERSGLRDEMGNPVDGPGWVARQPMPMQHEAVRNCIAGTGAGFDITYEKSTTCDGPATAPGCYYQPPTNITPSGGTIAYDIGETHPPVFLLIPPGAFPEMTPVFLTTTIGDHVQFPPGTLPSTYLVEVRRYGQGPPLQFTPPAQLQMRFPPSDQFMGFFRVLPDGQLQMHPASINPAQGLIQTQIQQGGIYVGLRAVPLPCPADFNQNGSVTAQDVFDFLAAFFTPGSLAADFNNSGAVTSQDIFDFLAAFFAPCP